ncbi:MAG: glycosyltransferase family 2 protein [Bacteroidetes bacterium]|nr:glycosyltransferase family 2 protein [Bacteroidota bacterium]MBS1628721.1 glycosyltransferase family 2 protein [Bacteroidota bacterium]
MNEISFSVVIPAYNAAGSIRATLDSCLNQSLPPLEVIVVDDAGSDESAPIVRGQFGDAVRLITLPRNSGPSAARNVGIAAAKGTFIAFLDSDDCWHPQKLERIHELLLARPEIDFLFHTYTYGKEPAILSEAMFRPRRMPLWKLLLRNPIATPCAVIRRSPELHFDERMRHMEDYELFLRLAAKHDVWRISAPLTRLGRPVLSAGGQSSDRLAMRAGEMQAWIAFARHNPAWYPALPLLFLLGILKHLGKALLRP